MKKLVIKPLRSRPQLPEDFETLNWNRLRDAVIAVQNSSPTPYALEELFRAVEDLCLHGAAPALFTRLRELSDTHAAQVVASLAQRVTLEAISFLPYVVRTWQAYCSQQLLTRQIFLYLDRTYVLNAAPVRSIFDLGLELFLLHWDKYPEVEKRSVEGLISLIDAERAGEAVDRDLLRELLRMLSNLGIYEKAFQLRFLKQAATWYAAEGIRMVQELDVPSYLLHCEKRLAEEHGRSDIYLEPQTRAPLVAAVETGLVEAHVGYILEHGLDSLLDQDCVADVNRLYGLCARVGALDALCASFKAHVRRIGGDMVADSKKDADMIPSLLRLKVRMDAMVEGGFKGNKEFGKAVREAFEGFINQRSGRPAELVAKHLDAVLRGALKGSGTAVPIGGDDEQDAAVDAALTLFRFLQGKDVFEAFYKKDLARRLLLGRSSSMDGEKSAVSKLKAECGSQFTSKLEGMFADIELSKEAMATFRKSLSAASALATVCPAVDLSVQVLTSGFWPSYPLVDLNLPSGLAAAQHVFAEHYLQKHSGRRLVWVNSLGTALVRAKFDSGMKELAVSAFQAAVLLLFNEADELSLHDIAVATGLEIRELRRTMQSLACGREQVLLKRPEGREIGEHDVFCYNAGFATRLYRVRINTVQLKETVEDNRKTNESVLQDRQHQIDAAIVRIMKTRKTLGHKLLVSELVGQLRFPVEATDLKKRIESLIDREYLERDDADPQVYNYLA